MKRFSNLWILPAVVILLLAGCQQQPGPVPVPTATEPPSVTLVPTQVIQTTPQATEDLPDLPHSAEDPLRFSFPTPGPQPASLWRPPLYEVPWALNPHDHFYFDRPIKVDVVNWPLADYRYGAIFFSSGEVHTGIDIPNRKGTPVLAAGPGTIIWAGYGLYGGVNNPKDPYGQAVTIKHNFGYEGHTIYTIYAHLDRIDVVNGQWVNTGDQIGAVGDTGNTTGPHLHFEIRIESNSYFTTRNPELWLAPPQGWGVLVGRLLNTNGSILNRQDVIVRSLATNQKWTVTTYGSDTINSDDYYRENLVLSDLPAGDYELSTNYLEKNPLVTQVTIHPGAITYFTFRGKYGFNPDAQPGPVQNNWLKFTNP